MMISILHKLLSTGTVATKADMEEVPLEAREGSKECTVNPIKGMGRPHRQVTTTTTRPLLPTQVPSHSSTRHLVEIALLPAVSAIMGVLDRHSHPRIHSNILALVGATIVACLMYLGALSRPIRGRTRDSVLIWASRAATTTHFATMVIHPKCLEVPVLR